MIGVFNSRAVLLGYLYINALKLIHGVKIKTLHVPQIIQLGSHVILDCDYSWEEAKDDGLVVKWYFNKEKIPVYQWIATQKPQVLGILKGRLNLEYTASQNSNNKHRALYITNLGPDLSGDYTCIVSSFNNEDQRTKNMLVFVPEKQLDLYQQRITDEVLEIFCSTKGVYPRPSMSLQIGNSKINNSVVEIEENAGLFDITVKAKISALTLPIELSCELNIPKANYTVRKEAICYPDSHGTVTTLSTFLKLGVLFIHIVNLPVK